MREGLIIVLPWPPKGLSPNDRPSRWALARAKKQYRRSCAWAAVAAGARRLDADRLRVRVRFIPPNANVRDTDNMVASIKSGLDGVAEVIGVDDSRWDLVLAPRGAPEPPGRVEVIIERREVTQ